MSLQRILISFMLMGLISGCTNKAYVKPRSQIVSEAVSTGKKLHSLKEDRELFYKPDRVNEERLISLLKDRSDPESRDKNYKIGGGDEVEINVFDVPELNVTVRVRQSGFIALPLIGAVQVAGKTEDEISSELKSRLGVFVKDPQVSVFVGHYGSQKVGVLGAVEKPATYALKKGGNTVLELISRAGGLTDKSGNYINFIPAETGIGEVLSDPEKRARMSFSSDSSNRVFKGNGIELPIDRVMGLHGGIPIEVPVRGGDMIVVGEAGQVLIEGEVEKAGAYDLGRRMTLLGALAASGGLTYAAKVDEVEIMRDVGQKDRGRLVVDLEKIARGDEADVRLRTGDIVRIPSHSGRHMTRTTMEAISRVINVGVGGNVNIAN